MKEVTPASQAWRGEPHDVGWLGLAAPGMRTVFFVLGLFGTAVGVVQVLLPAFADERGSAETGGLYLALLSAGSLAGGLVYGARTWPGSPVRRLPALMLGLSAGFALLAAANGPAVLAVLLLGCGLLLAPTTVVASTLLDTAAPARRLTEAFAVGSSPARRSATPWEARSSRTPATRRARCARVGSCCSVRCWRSPAAARSA